GNFASALTALSQSFLDPAAQLTLGVYHAYGTGPGDLANGLTSQNMFAHPSIIQDAEPGDRRVNAKIRPVGERSLQGATSSIAFSMYQTDDAPVAIIRNEELILLRAEANIGLGNIQAAADDINFIRVTSGGLPTRTITAAN